jgi:hypothetical protein
MPENTNYREQKLSESSSQKHSIGTSCRESTKKDDAVVRWPLAGYRKFLGPDEAKGIRDGKAPCADVVELKVKVPRPLNEKLG